MKFHLFALAALCYLNLATAQEPPLPSATATPTSAPNARPELNIPDIPVPVEPSPLVPNTSPGPKKNVPTITELDSAFQQTPLGQAAEEQRLHLAWRKLQNRASQEKDVIAAKRAIKTARTDIEKRDFMRAYYKLFYTRMQAMADKPDVKAYLEQKKNIIVGSLAQPRVHPEEAPRPTPDR